MQLSLQAHYDADLDRVAAMLADPAFVEAKVRASGAVSHQLDVAGTAAEAFTVTTRRQMPTDDIPAQFRSLVGATLEVLQVEVWEAPEPEGRNGTVVVEITGAPVRVTGRLRLVTEPDGSTTQRFDGDVKASIPLFSAPVEQAAAGALRTALAAEERTATAWLAR